MKKLSILAVACLGVVNMSAWAANTTATVISAEPIYERVQTPRQRCVTENVTQQVPMQSPRAGNNNVAGSVLGGLAGALIGSQIGDGNGKKAAIAAGAIGGTLLGAEISQNGMPGQGYSQGYSTQTMPVERCTTYMDESQTVNGYHVTYEYAGQQYHTTMPNKPGRRIDVDVQVTPRMY